MADSIITVEDLVVTVLFLFTVGIVYLVMKSNLVSDWLETNRKARMAKQGFEEALLISRIDEIERNIMTDPTKKRDLLSNVKLAETRTREGKQILLEIDSGGYLYVDAKGLHYIGAVRRMSWEWSKILQVQHSSQKALDFMIFELASRHNVILPVSNRQRLSGFQFTGTASSRDNVVSFLSRLSDEPPARKRGRNTSRPQKKSQSVIHITQNISDSVIQGDVIGIKDHE
jgi:hypothetical protein